MAIRPILRILSSTLLLVSLLSACSTIRGSGNLTTESRPVSGLSEVELVEAGELTIEQTGTESLSIEAEDNLLPMLTSRVVNGRLLLDVRDNMIVRPTQPIIYKVTVKELNKLILSGSGTVDVPDLTGDKLTLVISASGNARIAGQVTSQEIEISGSGTYRAEDLDSQAAKVEISGSGKAIVKARQTLDAEISSSGSVEYIGDPVVNSEVSGSGHIRKR